MSKAKDEYNYINENLIFNEFDETVISGFESLKIDTYIKELEQQVKELKYKLNEQEQELNDWRNNK